MSIKGAAAAVIGICLAAGVLSGCVPATPAVSGASAPQTSGDTAAPSAAVAAPVPAAPATPAGARVVVTRVIDGDTVEVDGRERVRVLGIDSCEMATTAGRRARADADAALTRRSVTLVSEPGVDRDRYGRELRYITMPDGRDFGAMMVTRDHTGIYQGSNDAAPSYLARLRDLDRGGRACAARPAPAPSAAPRATVAADPVPRHKPARPATAPRRTAPPAPSAGAAYYKNCAAARAANAAPLYRGQAGYSAKLDRDGDGVACE